MRYRYQSRGSIEEVLLERHGGSFQATVGGMSYTVEVLSDEPGELSLLFDGKPVRLYWAAAGDKKWVSMDGCSYLLEKPAPAKARGGGDKSAESSLRSPMPAQVQAVQVAEGETVEKGQTLLLLEAMKMEIRLSAPRGGKVTRLLVQAGQTVQRDQTLIEIA
jgi:acetyl/propionyl-CoA carboxylase alpha subunit